MTKSDRPYSDAFLSQQRRRLEEAREELLDHVEWDEEELLNWQDADDTSDQHPGDAARATAEMELNLALIENASAQLEAIDAALAKLDDGTYGWDDESGAWIGQARLEALPWARRTIQAQKALEERFEQEPDRHDHGSEGATEVLKTPEDAEGSGTEGGAANR